MEQQKIREIIKEKTGELFALSGKIGADFDKDIIHDFRVAVKTLRSFLRLLRMHFHEPDLKMPKKFKRLYHIAGAIRDAQLELKQMADKQQNIPHYSGKLHQMLERQKKEWHKHYSKKALGKLEDRLLGFKYETLDTTTLANFFETRIAAIDELGKIKSPDDNQVHTIRKQAKDILYTARLAKTEWKGAHKQVKGIPMKQLNKLADEIGDYNDKRITMEHLTSFSSRTIEEHEKKNIKTICKEDARQLNAKKKAIMKEVKGISFLPLVGNDNK